MGEQDPEQKQPVVSGGDPDPSRVAALLELAAGGEADAWRELLGWYARRVFALAHSRLRNKDLAEEVAQSVFATVAIKLGRGEYTEQGRFEAWLMRVAMNRVRDEMRRLKRQAPTSDPASLAESARAAEDEHSRDEERLRLRNLRTALDELTESDREIIELRHHGGMSFKQMADLLNEPLGTLLARHHRALRKLKERMEEFQAAQAKAGTPREGAA